MVCRKWKPGQMLLRDPRGGSSTGQVLLGEWGLAGHKQDLCREKEEGKRGKKVGKEGGGRGGKGIWDGLCQAAPIPPLSLHLAALDIRAFLLPTPFSLPKVSLVQTRFPRIVQLSSHSPITPATDPLLPLSVMMHLQSQTCPQ